MIAIELPTLQIGFLVLHESAVVERSKSLIYKAEQGFADYSFGRVRTVSTEGRSRRGKEVLAGSFLPGFSKGSSRFLVDNQCVGTELNLMPCSQPLRKTLRARGRRR